jgi:hypothetical protein
MKVAFTTLSNALFEESRLKLTASAAAFGADTIFSYTHEDFRQTEFYKENEVILSQPRGLGYWLWKPYIISESLKKLDEGDILFYADAGSEIIASLEPLVHICKTQQDIVLFANGNLINKEWTKRDCFILMDCDVSACRNALQCDAALCFFRKTEQSVRFVEEWLNYGKDPRIMTDLPNTQGKRNSWRLIQHRYDQSILSLQAFKYKLVLYRMPTQFGNHYKSVPYRISGEFNCVNQKRVKQVSFYSSRPYVNSPYFQLLNHHRSRKFAQSGKPRPFLKKIEMRIKQWL